MKIKRMPDVEEEPPRSAMALKDDAAFWEFHDNNPHIIDKLVELARDDMDAGLDSFGLDAYFTVIRYAERLQTKSNDGFSLNQRHRSRYARMLLWLYPEFTGFFRIKDGASVTGFDPSRGGDIPPGRSPVAS